ncbi:MAG: hypothetical protein EOO88_19585 [Pedobacter sp.]|nr:MAG: hypothetical protein EOO88_19585 [Pedobacter sp.]
MPDTLVLKTKTGEQLILIGGDLNKFRTLRTDSMISRALYRMRDSLAKSKSGPLLQKDSIFRVGTPAQRFTKVLQGRQVFLLQPLVGAALIKDKLSPYFSLAIDFAPQRQDYYTRAWPGMYTYLNIAASAYYLFDRAENTNRTSTPIFIDLSLGNRMNNGRVRQSRFDEFGFGVGYLVRNEGDYFQRNTFRLFGHFIASNSVLRFSPELYITDNFKRVFPGISLDIRLFN